MSLSSIIDLIMKHFALVYEVVENYAERREPYRAAHLRLVQQAYERGEIVMAGALGEPPSGALLIFHAESPAVAEQFVHTDPYVAAGIVTRWQVKPWHLVVGVAQ